jgi:hypothetical protein
MKDNDDVTITFSSECVKEDFISWLSEHGKDSFDLFLEDHDLDGVEITISKTQISLVG